MSDVYSQAVTLHREHKGKLSVAPVVIVKDKNDLSLVYTPGVAQVSREIAKNPHESFGLTWRGRAVAVISDGSAVLGLGNIGPEAAMPVMEGKALLFKQFGDVEAVPICVDLHTAEEIVHFVRAIAPSFGAVNLEDIAAPTCIEVEDRLQDLGIPVFHDDQHGTAVVVAAALRNAAKVVGKRYEDLRVVISGAGAAGLAIAQMLLGYERREEALVKVEAVERVKEVRLVDSIGLINAERDGLAGWKAQFARITNPANIAGGIAAGVTDMDVFVGVSRGGLLTSEMVKSMAEKPIVLAMANPDPEILPEIAKEAGAAIMGTGRSDYPNQVNNSLAFPSIFKGVLAARATKITTKMKLAASEALAGFVTPTAEKILPTMFDEGLVDKIAEAVATQAKLEGVIR